LLTTLSKSKGGMRPPGKFDAARPPHGLDESSPHNFDGAFAAAGSILRQAPFGSEPPFDTEAQGEVQGRRQDDSMNPAPTGTKEVTNRLLKIVEPVIVKYAGDVRMMDLHQSKTKEDEN